MSNFYFGQKPYQTYLQENALTRDASGQIARNVGSIKTRVSLNTLGIIASNFYLAQQFGEKFDAVSRALAWGIDHLIDGLSQVDASIEKLRADYVYAAGLLLDQLQIQNRHLSSVLERLDAIHKTLENPTLTQAREFYRIGSERLSRGLLDKSLEAFHKAEEKNDTDFFVQFQLGKLYLYGLDKDDNVVNLEKARQHLKQAARYAEAEMPFLSEFARWAGEAHLQCSIACYLRANELHIAGKPDEARQLIEEARDFARHACEVYPKLSESHYHLAKFSALLGNAGEAVASLERAIIADRNYCLKAETDKDF
ncbi:hypothetical protein CH330_02830, partial [candidate division WOR-3 bacterium JGI_Cruoil_03_51_56]